MKFISFFLLFLISVSIFANNSLDDFFNPSEWKEVYTKDGVTVYSQKSKHSSIVGFKAEAVLVAPLENILATLRDVEGTINWAPNITEKSTIKEFSDLKAITYTNNDLPWPAADRDMVQMNELRLDIENKYLVVDTFSIEDDSYPLAKDIVRANVTFGTLKFRRKGAHSSVLMTLLVDPKGSLPIWLVNMLQKRLPYQFLMALEKEAVNSKVPLRSGIKDLLKKLDSLK
ncbi:START domain-containing protein [Halobacteriovorax sp.]|uniref:START domain-containing protein n=1 Tax=Halobacteriovorax sp. TaxID=2020862 RepID=UPI00356AD853